MRRAGRGSSAASAPAQKPTRRYARSATGFAAPAIVAVSLLLYLPFLWTGYLSFTEYSGFGTPRWVGFDKYVQVFQDPGFFNSTLNTIYWVVGTLVLPVGLGLLIAVLAYGLRGAFWYRLPFLIPFAISGVAVGVIWSFILQHGGAADQVLAVFGVTDPPRWLLDAPLNTVVMIAAAAWQGVGVNALLFTVGLQSIPHEPLEAARLDGASGWRMFTAIIWPMLRPLTTVVVGLAIVGSLKQFDIIFAMTRGGPGRSSETLALTMYKDTFNDSDYGLGAAIAILLTIVTVAASVLYLRRQLSDSEEAARG
ncbi:carbohydrate ABC transporter permease [Glaciibacter psychrotolerans]|uniref:Multiple sugar transport system permease protein n=1 Tax=Glaciibacter psychrotolerans TaxID=670054 RepID=A0A7Z0J4M9_9MICO|nr:sugar ABC transporter permease [Leifsonia psychrotolerans]NYJ18562.1 multiple sugar transport system permease protein [Leifsonia psychrotolerans]